MSSPSHLPPSSPLLLWLCLHGPLPNNGVVRGRDRPGGHGLPGGVLLLPVPGAAGHRLPLRQVTQESGRQDQEDHPEEMAQEEASGGGLARFEGGGAS